MKESSFKERSIKKRGNEKGITLVALVVTIIVLLILAGVSIRLLIGENGIIQRSKDSTKRYDNSALNEKLQMDETEKWIGNYITNGDGSGESITEIDDNIPLPPGFTHEDGTKDTGLVIKDSEGNEWVWVPVDNPSDMFIDNGVSVGNHAGRLYATELGNHFNIGLTGQAYTSQLREPYTEENKTEIPDALLQTEFNQMKASVEKYKGFYVGRYETGNLSSSKVVVQKGNTDISGISESGSQTWYTMYQKGKDMYAANTSVNSSMIWGCQWDQIMRWMRDIPNKTNTSNKYILDSTDMGNYTGTQLPTGSSEDYKVKNTYDMAGNVSEWTLEAYKSINYKRSGVYIVVDLIFLIIL